VSIANLKVLSEKLNKVESIAEDGELNESESKRVRLENSENVEANIAPPHEHNWMLQPTPPGGAGAPQREFPCKSAH